jgi:hypothetical protein
MFLPLFDVRCVRTVSADEFLREFIALIETFSTDFDAMFKVIELVLKDLR